MHGCDCPRGGAYLCLQCLAYLARAAPDVARWGPAVEVQVAEESERSFQGRVRRAALDLGWHYHHEVDSRGDLDTGWPDTFLAKPGTLIIWELKVGTHKPTQEQLTWLSLFRTVPGVVDASVRYPREWDAMLEILSKTMEGPNNDSY